MSWPVKWCQSETIHLNTEWLLESKFSTKTNAWITEITLSWFIIRNGTTIKLSRILKENTISVLSLVTNRKTIILSTNLSRKELRLCKNSILYISKDSNNSIHFTSTLSKLTMEKLLISTKQEISFTIASKSMKMITKRIINTS